jgi:hypothetical protein
MPSVSFEGERQFDLKNAYKTLIRCSSTRPLGQRCEFLNRVAILQLICNQYVPVRIRVLAVVVYKQLTMNTSSGEKLRPCSFLALFRLTSHSGNGFAGVVDDARR